MASAWGASFGAAFGAAWGVARPIINPIAPSAPGLKGWPVRIPTPHRRRSRRERETLHLLKPWL